MYVQEQRKLAADLSVDKKPYVLNQAGQWVPNIGTGAGQFATEGEANIAAQTVLSTAKDGYINGNISNDAIRQQMNKSQQAWDNLQAKQATITEVSNLFAPQIEKIKESLPKVETSFAGKTVNQNDFADLWIIKNDKPGKEQAAQRLNGKFGNQGVWQLSQETEVPITQAGGVPAVGRGGNMISQYSTVKKALDKDASLTNVLNTVEDEYRKRQSATVSKRVTYGVGKPEEQRDNATNFTSMITKVKDLAPGSTTGPINDMLAVLETGSKGFEGNHYESWVNQETGRATLRVSRGNGSPLQVEIPASTYYQIFPDQQVSDEFQYQFGAKFAQNQGRYTGVGRASAIPVTLPRASPYIVQYNVEKTAEGQYNMRWWLTNKSDVNNPIVNGETANGSVPDMPINMTEADVVEWSKKFGDPAFIDRFVRYRQAPPVQQ